MLNNEIQTKINSGKKQSSKKIFRTFCMWQLRLLTKIFSTVSICQCFIYKINTKHIFWNRTAIRVPVFHILWVLLLTTRPISQTRYGRCKVVGQGATAWQNTCLRNQYKRQQLFITFCNCVWLWRQKTDKSTAADLRLRLPFPAIWIINRSIS